MNLYRVELSSNYLRYFVVCETFEQAHEWARGECTKHFDDFFQAYPTVYSVVHQENIAAVWRKPADVTLPFAGGWS